MRRSARAAALWPDTTDERWSDWRWQLSHRLGSVAELERCIELSTSERRALEAEGLQADSLAEEAHTVVPGLGHRYPDRVLLDLVRRLVRARVRPYYLYQCDLVRGAGHFRTPVAKGVEIMEALRGWTSGYAVPTYVIDMPDGGGKVPIAPQYLISASDRRVALRNFEGVVGAYVEPEAYASHDRGACTYCRAATASGVTGLLEGRGDMLRPTDWHEGRLRP